MQYVVIDEAGPFFLTSQKPRWEQVYILVCVELVTYRAYLITMQDATSKNLIRALEQLQSRRGRVSTIILDETRSHEVLINPPGPNILGKLLKSNQASLLTKAGVSIVMAPGKRHERVGRSETVVRKVKKVLISCLGSFNFNDSWDFIHQVSLVEYHLNERPLFFSNSSVLTPNSIEVAMLKRSPQSPNP